MKILYIHQLFRTPDEGGGIRSYYLARALVDAGYHVDLITTHNAKSGTELIDGIHVHYLRIPYNNSFGFLRRLWAYGSFVLRARSFAKSLPKPDLAYVMTTPLTTGWIATWLKKKLGIPYYFEVGDLWPDVPIEMGVIKNKWLKKWLLTKEKAFYDQSEKVIAMSPPQVAHIKRKTNRAVELIPNMADTEFYSPHFRLDKISRQHPYRILYCGAHGRANQLEFLIMAAQLSQHLPVQFTLMGEGAEKDKIVLLGRHLKNVTFLPHGNKETVRDQMDLHDAVYISFQNLVTLHTGCPNKFFDALASGKMIISNLSGWTADLIQEKQIGFAYDPETPEDFVHELNSFLDVHKVQHAQKNAYVLSKAYTRSKLSKRFLACIENP